MSSPVKGQAGGHGAFAAQQSFHSSLPPTAASPLSNGLHPTFGKVGHPPSNEHIHSPSKRKADHELTVSADTSAHKVARNVVHLSPTGAPALTPSAVLESKSQTPSPVRGASAAPAHRALANKLRQAREAFADQLLASLAPSAPKGALDHAVAQGCKDVQACYARCQAGPAHADLVAEVVDTLSQEAPQGNHAPWRRIGLTLAQTLLGDKPSAAQVKQFLQGLRPGERGCQTQAPEAMGAVVAGLREHLGEAFTPAHRKVVADFLITAPWDKAHPGQLQAVAEGALGYRTTGWPEADGKAGLFGSGQAARDADVRALVAVAAGLQLREAGGPLVKAALASRRDWPEQVDTLASALAAAARELSTKRLSSLCLLLREVVGQVHGPSRAVHTVLSAACQLQGDDTAMVAGLLADIALQGTTQLDALSVGAALAQLVGRQSPQKAMAAAIAFGGALRVLAAPQEQAAIVAAFLERAPQASATWGAAVLGLRNGLEQASSVSVPDLVDGLAQAFPETGSLTAWSRNWGSLLLALPQVLPPGAHDDLVTALYDGVIAKADTWPAARTCAALMGLLSARQPHPLGMNEEALAALYAALEERAAAAGLADPAAATVRLALTLLSDPLAAFECEAWSDEEAQALACTVYRWPPFLATASRTHAQVKALNDFQGSARAQVLLIDELASHPTAEINQYHFKALFGKLLDHAAKLPGPGSADSESAAAEPTARAPTRHQLEHAVLRLCRTLADKAQVIDGEGAELLGSAREGVVEEVAKQMREWIHARLPGASPLRQQLFKMVERILFFSFADDALDDFSEGETSSGLSD